MPGTPTRFDSTRIRAGSVGQLWAGLAVPAAGARLTLDADGTPDATANPNAKHLGHTAAGTTGTINFDVTDHMADEVVYPLATSINGTSMELTGELIQIFDEEALKVLTAGFGTYATGSGYKEFAIGTKSSITYSSVALIWPTQMDPTKFAVFHIYNAFNTGGLNITVDRNGRSSSPFTFRGYALTARAATDVCGKYWFQTT
jgi:hypothetical protein